MIMSVSPQLLPSSYFQAAILWQCWHSLQHHSPRGHLESLCIFFFSDRMSQGWKRETHMPGTLWRGGEWPWLFCHPVEKATECAKLATVALFLFPDCLSKVEMAFSRPEEGLCLDASRQTIITWEPETVLKYCRHFSWWAALESGCSLKCSLGSHTVHATCTVGLCRCACKSMITMCHLSLVQTCPSLYWAHAADRETKNIVIVFSNKLNPQFCFLSQFEVFKL